MPVRCNGRKHCFPNLSSHPTTTATSWTHHHPRRTYVTVTSSIIRSCLMSSAEPRLHWLHCRSITHAPPPTSHVVARVPLQPRRHPPWPCRHPRLTVTPWATRPRQPRPLVTPLTLHSQRRCCPCRAALPQPRPRCLCFSNWISSSSTQLHIPRPYHHSHRVMPHPDFPWCRWQAPGVGL
jgi:hypothetical protein